MQIRLTILFSLLNFFVAAQQTNNILQHGALKVSTDRRFLVHEDGTPFIWLGDTGWELFHRLKKEEVIKYLSKRVAQGFTVIQAVVLAEFDGLHVPNANGDLPLHNDDPLHPNEDYFQYVDWVIDKAAEVGIYIGLLPTWGDKVYKDKWGAGPEIFNESNSKSYGNWIGRRYRNRKNIIWIMGGDRNPRNDQDVNIWRAMAAGIAEGAGGNDKVLLTFHPQPSESCSSSTWFQHDDWLDFNMLQTGHCRDTKVWEKIGGDYNNRIVKPTLNGEAVYEDHPLCFNAKELGYTAAYDVRKAAYLSIFAGSLGFTYGCHSMWQFYTPAREGVNGPLRYWYVSMDLPGARQMGFLRGLMQSFPVLDRVPDQQVLLDTLDGTKRIQATRGKDFLLVYTAGGEPIRLHPGVIRGSKLNAYWFDPRTGARISIGSFNNKSLPQFTPFSKGEDSDWVLVLFDAAKNYF